MRFQQEKTAKQDREQKRDPGNAVPDPVADECGDQANGAEQGNQKRDAEYLPDGSPPGTGTCTGHEVSTGSREAACVAASILSTLEPDWRRRSHRYRPVISTTMVMTSSTAQMIFKGMPP